MFKVKDPELLKGDLVNHHPKGLCYVSTIEGRMVTAIRVNIRRPMALDEKTIIEELSNFSPVIDRSGGTLKWNM